MMWYFSTWKAIGNFLLNKEMWYVLGGIVKASFYLGFTKILAWCGVSGKKSGVRQPVESLGADREVGGGKNMTTSL